MSFIEFAVFPVPASGVLHGRISNLPTGNRKAWIEMIDVFGNVVYQAAVLHEFSIPVGMLASGMYLLSVEIAGRYATRKVMVQD